MEFCASLSISASVSVAGVNQALSLDMQRQSLVEFPVMFCLWNMTETVCFNYYKIDKIESVQLLASLPDRKFGLF